MPSLDGTWLVRWSNDGPPVALASVSSGGVVAVAVPGGVLSLPDGSIRTVTTPGQGTWRPRGFPDAEMTAAVLQDGPDALTTPVLMLGARITLAQTGQQWTGAVWIEPRDGDGRSGPRVEVGTLAGTRVLYGRQ